MHQQHPQAAAAIRAAKNLHSWGPWATRRFLRNQHRTPLRLMYLAYSLENAQ